MLWFFPSLKPEFSSGLLNLISSAFISRSFNRVKKVKNSINLVIQGRIM